MFWRSATRSRTFEWPERRRRSCWCAGIRGQRAMVWAGRTLAGSAARHAALAGKPATHVETNYDRFTIIRISIHIMAYYGYATWYLFFAQAAEGGLQGGANPNKEASQPSQLARQSQMVKQQKRSRV